MITTAILSKMNFIAIKKVILYSSIMLGSIITPCVVLTPDKKETPFEILKEKGYSIKSFTDVSKLLDYDKEQIIRFVAVNKKGETVTGLVIDGKIKLDLM